MSKAKINILIVQVGNRYCLSGPDGKTAKITLQEEGWIMEGIINCPRFKPVNVTLLPKGTVDWETVINLKL